MTTGWPGMRYPDPEVDNMILKRNPTLLPGLMFVIVAHGALLYFLLKQQFISPPKQLETLMVSFIPRPGRRKNPNLNLPSRQNLNQ